MWATSLTLRPEIFCGDQLCVVLEFQRSPFSSECLTELTFWRSQVANLNGLPIWPERNKPSKIFYSDASASARVSFIEFEANVFHQNWSDFEKSQSSTFRELLAVSLSLKAFTESLQAQSVTWLTDNQNVVRIVNCGSRVPSLQDPAMGIFQTRLLNGVSIDMQWIPRNLNSTAGDISKFIDHDDYTINDTVPHRSCLKVGPLLAIALL